MLLGIAIVAVIIFLVSTLGGSPSVVATQPYVEEPATLPLSTSRLAAFDLGLSGLGSLDLGSLPETLPETMAELAKLDLSGIAEAFANSPQGLALGLADPAILSDQPAGTSPEPVQPTATPAPVAPVSTFTDPTARPDKILTPRVAYL